jgi:predicted enzyme involved in methoxymalonyl-ACP biosynthesis
LTGLEYHSPWGLGDLGAEFNCELGRVIGRGVENAFVGFAQQLLLGRGAREMIGEYLPTRKNGLAANLYKDLGFEHIGEELGTSRWRLPIRTVAAPIPEWITIEPVKEPVHVG